MGVSVYSAIFSVDYAALEETSGSIIGTLGFLGIGLLLVTFKSRFIIDEKRLSIIKEYRVFGGSLSADKIEIPKNANEILIVPKKKRGEGYVNAVVPFGYALSSYDVYFSVNNKLIQIIKTDRKRAIIIAALIRSVTKLEYSIKE